MKKSVIYFGNESYFVFGNRSDLFSVFGTKKMPPLNKSGINILEKRSYPATPVGGGIPPPLPVSFPPLIFFLS